MIPVLVYVLARCCRVERPRDVVLGWNEIVLASVYLGIYKTKFFNIQCVQQIAVTRQNSGRFVRVRKKFARNSYEIRTNSYEIRANFTFS